MKDVHIACRTAICMIALVAASALPAEAQPRNLGQVDEAVKQQQASLDQLKPSLDRLQASVEELTRENDALRQTLAEINRRPAPPEAWNALRQIGLLFVVAWAAVAIIRVWRHEAK